MTSFRNIRDPNFSRMVNISIGPFTPFRSISTYQSTNIFRVLLSSSFIPFIVTFLHTIAAKDMANVTLLEQVVSTLENFRNASQGSERLYQICSTFTQVAKKLVQSHPLSIGIYNQQQDSLTISDTSRSTSLFSPEIFQNTFEDGDINCGSPSYAMDILNDWLSGPPFPWEKMDVNSENYQR